MTDPKIRLGADIGGTFTDVVLEVGAARVSTKVLTTYAAPEDAIVTGLHQVCAKAGITPDRIGQIIHGTTLATNALIERRGAHTALITTDGSPMPKLKFCATRLEDGPMKPRSGRTLPRLRLPVQKMKLAPSKNGRRWLSMRPALPLLSHPLQHLDHFAPTSSSTMIGHSPNEHVPGLVSLFGYQFTDDPRVVLKERLSRNWNVVGADKEKSSMISVAGVGGQGKTEFCRTSSIYLEGLGKDTFRGIDYILPLMVTMNQRTTYNPHELLDAGTPSCGASLRASVGKREKLYIPPRSTYC